MGVKHTPLEALSTALAMEGVNYPGERGQRILDRLWGLGFAITEDSNWVDREPQLLGLVQDEI